MRRRALAPISRTVDEAESSIQMWSLGRDSSSVPVIFLQSSLVHVAGAEFVGVDARFRSKQAQQERLLRHFQAENRHWLAIMAQRDMFPAIFSASAVLPIEGRAARMMSSEGCRPAVSLSRLA
jgi:hypothetical protein